MEVAVESAALLAAESALSGQVKPAALSGLAAVGSGLAVAAALAALESLLAALAEAAVRSGLAAGVVKAAALLAALAEEVAAWRLHCLLPLHKRLLLLGLPCLLAWLWRLQKLCH